VYSSNQRNKKLLERPSGNQITNVPSLPFSTMISQLPYSMATQTNIIPSQLVLEWFESLRPLHKIENVTPQTTERTRTLISSTTKDMILQHIMVKLGEPCNQ